MSAAIDSRRDHIVTVARELFESRGIQRTSMSDIAEAAEINRSALYRCFPDKDALIEAFLDNYASDFVDCFFLWEDTRDIKDVRQSAGSFVKTLRLILFESTLFRRRASSFERAEFYLKFTNLAFDKLSDAFIERTYSRYKERHDIEIEHVRETFYIMAAGMAMYVKAHPDANDEMLTDIMIQTLRLTDGSDR